MKRKYRNILNGLLWLIGLISIILGILAFPSIYSMVFPPPSEEKLIISPTVKNVTTSSNWDIEFPFTITNNYDFPLYNLEMKLMENIRKFFMLLLFPHTPV